MPPDAPQANESDYGAAPARRSVAPASVVGTSAVAFSGIDLPIPAHLLERDATPALNKAVAEILAEPSETVPKNGWNKYHDYKYATADDIRASVAQRLGKHGLSYEQHEIAYTAFDKLIAVHYYFVLVHQSGETAPPQRVTALTRIIDNYGKPDDKAFSKVAVLALKDWSKGRFSIPTGDIAEDPDTAQDLHQGAQSSPQRPPQSRPPSRSASSHAFRDAGLTKVTPPQEPPPSDDPPPGPVTDPWLAGVLHYLAVEQDREAWLNGLRQALVQCVDMDTFGQIKSAKRVKLTLEKGSLAVRQALNTMFDEAKTRLSAVLGSDDGVTQETSDTAPQVETAHD